MKYFRKSFCLKKCKKINLIKMIFFKIRFILFPQDRLKTTVKSLFAVLK